jgi:hypothetical protein
VNRVTQVLFDPEKQHLSPLKRTSKFAYFRSAIIARTFKNVSRCDDLPTR